MNITQCVDVIKRMLACNPLLWNVIKPTASVVFYYYMRNKLQLHTALAQITCQTFVGLDKNKATS